MATAIAGLNLGYSFKSSVSLGGKVATQASGRWIAGGSEFTISTNGTSITYRSLPPNSWVLQAGQGWVEVDGTIPGGSPLDALATPVQVSLVVGNGPGLDFRAMYPAARLGLAGDGTVPVDIVLASDGSITATYTDPAGSANSTTILRPDPAQLPIAAPSPS
ncbi:MAG: hypothetical protein ACRDGQ_11665 [Candidatus Limnocylindrales bacterium]